MSNIETHRVEVELGYNGEARMIRTLPKGVKWESVREIYLVRSDGERVLLKPTRIDFDSMVVNSYNDKERRNDN